MVRGRDCATRLCVFTIVLTVVVLTIAACRGESSPDHSDMESTDADPVSVSEVELSDTARAGEELFNANCSVCHGLGATGTNLGPPLIDDIYHPGHHADFSIRIAVRNGVKAHHWRFGDMAPVAGVSPEEVDMIICYIREVQRAAGIFEGDSFSTMC